MYLDIVHKQGLKCWRSIKNLQSLLVLGFAPRTPFERGKSTLNRLCPLALNEVQHLRFLDRQMFQHSAAFPKPLKPLQSLEWLALSGVQYESQHESQADSQLADVQ